MKGEMLRADDLKTKLLDWLIPLEKNAIFANELLFSPKKRRADLVCLKDGELTAYEIKGDCDSIRRLKEQIHDYKLTFDFVYIVITKKFLKKIKSIQTPHIGIIVFDKQFQIIKTATKNKNFKSHLVYLLDKYSLLRSIKTLDETQSLDYLRKKAARRLSLIQLKKLSYSRLFSRYYPLYHLFTKDRNRHTSPDDLLNLTGEIGPLR